MLGALLTAFAVVGAPLEPGEQLTYRGVMVAEKEDGVASRKEFTAVFVLDQGAGDGVSALWMLKEEGRGGWPWPARFGVAPAAATWPAESGPALLYEREDLDTVVPLPALLFNPPQPLAEGGKWNVGKQEYRVKEKAVFAGRPSWRVEVHTPYGRKRTLWIDRDSPLVLGIDENVFIGQGEKHIVRYQLVNRTKLPQDQHAPLIASVQGLAQLRNRVSDKPREKKLALTPEQQALVQTETAKLVAKAPEASLASEILKAAAVDAKEQMGRSGAVAALQGGAVGKPVPAFKLKVIGEGEITNDDLQGQITVLHFWEYRDTPLREPYGQVGYIDFLYRQSKGAVQVYGVCVNPDLTDSPRKAEQSAKKFKSFMNLSYPVLLHNDDLIRKLGDPRATGAKLPLYVVIGPDGKVTHYHVGEYEVSRDRGLEALNTAINQAKKKGE